MIKAMVVGLLASAGLVPAASAQDGSLRDAMRARMQARAEARQDVPRAPTAAPRAGGGEWRRPDRPERVDSSGWGRRDRGDGARPGAGWTPPPVAAPASPVAPQWGAVSPRGRDGDAGSRAEWQSGRRDRSPGWDARDDRAEWRDGRRDWLPGAGRNDDERARRAEAWRSDRAPGEWDRRDRGRDGVTGWGSGGNQGWAEDRGSRARWNRDWRRDRRFDWSGYRSSNRYAYRLPRYYAPYGWGDGYTRFGIGVRIAPTLFARSYWIDDPWSYRLPDAYGPYRWVRYYDDALLVDLDRGQVVDVIYGIFW
ncbi:RcnB family protein [Sphingomonas sp. BK235]|uniref:RcnB family protein n=1 Tax=Sphingomonas sp. BK235 TaxID=2512131 RepID=UPI0010DA8808|nr:RcnB family protein [Sphingomonas sp. BK235]TCP37437.1 nickel/cobalt transporter regulator [Sphingomonas sp. BK235]